MVLSEEYHTNDSKGTSPRYSAANENRIDFYGARPINCGMSNAKVPGIVDKDGNGDKEKS